VAKRFVRDDLDKLYDHGIDLSSRTIILAADIEDYSAESVLKGLHVLDSATGDITIKLSTDGGDWYSGMAIHDTILACSNRVRIVGLGKIMSMGAVILQAADERVLGPNATMLVHYGSDWFSGHTKDLERRAEESKRSSAIMEDIFLKRIREKHPLFSREDFKTKFSFDVFMSAQEAIDLGLADSILET